MPNLSQRLIESNIDIIFSLLKLLAKSGQLSSKSLSEFS